MSIGLLASLACAVLAAEGAAQQFVQPAYPVEGQPAAIAVIDLDGDARPDLVTANHDDDSVSLLRARPQGGFEPALSWPAGNGPIALRVADMNLDGNDDVLIVDELSSQLTVLWLTDEGETVTTSSYAQAGQPLDLAAGDLDGDGDVDVVIAETELHRIAVRLGLGPEGLGSPTTYAVGERPVAVELTDLDGDGDLDLMTLNQDTRDVSVRINDGSGAFSANPSFNVGSMPTDLAVADFNGDGQADAAVCKINPPSVRLLMGDGSGGLQGGPFLTPTDPPLTLAAGELNGDGWPDLVATTSWPVGFCVLPSAGGGAYLPAVPHFPLNSFQCATLADLDDDGRTDLVLEESAGVLLLSGDGQGGFREPVSSMIQPPIGDTQLADVNGDGLEDLLGQHVFGAVEARLADGAGGFGAPITSPVSGGDSLATADFDGDSVLDVVIGSYDDLHLGLGDGQGAFVEASTFPLAMNIVMDSDAADLTGDGAADLVLVSRRVIFSQERHTLQILPGDGAGALGTATTTITYATYAGDLYYDDLLLADVDGDGDLDVVVADGTASVVRPFLNDGSGGLIQLGSSFVNGLEGDQERRTLAGGDLDGDGDLDLAVRTGVGVSVMLGSGGASFAAPIQIASSFVGFARRHIAAGDVDGDGDMDLVCNDEIAHFMLLRGDGAGAFEEERHGTGTYVSELDLGRIDGDGLPDVVVQVPVGGNVYQALSYLNLALSAQWDDLGFGLAGTDGVPSLVGQGTLETGSAGTLKLAHAKPVSLALLFISAQSLPTPFKGGVLATVPPLLSFTLFTSPSGAINLAWPHWPAGAPGSTLYFQYGIADPAGPSGVALSNALRATHP